jgi:AcrR family transcriptional regulator
MGRPAKYTRAQLQAAALGLVDRHGIGGLSMRTLAKALRTGPMTLYNHVTDREDLDVLVVDAVMGKTQWSREPHADWRSEVAAIATAGWRAVRAHPHAIPLILTRRSRSPAVLEMSEALLRALSRSGRSERRLLIAFRAVTAFVMGFAQAELAGPLAVEAGEAAETVIGRIRALPRARFPRLVEIAGAAATSDPETEFRRGLDVLLAGLAVGASGDGGGRGRA